MKALFKFSVTTGSIGLLLILSIFLSKSSYPDMFFKIVAPLGLFLVFSSVILGFVSWLWYLKNSIKKKEYIWATIVAALGLFVIMKEIIKLI